MSLSRNSGRFTSLMLLLLALTSTNVFALHSRAPYKRQKVRHVHMRRMVARWNPLLRGSHDSMLRQNEEIDRLQLPRIANDEELMSLEVREELVPLSDSRSLHIASGLDSTRRYCRPWTRWFVEDLSEAYYERFRQPLQLTSAVRTVEQQQRLRRHNGNAAPAEGDVTSSHLAGVSIDIGKRGMTLGERRWIDQYILQLHEQGLVEAAEERRQACYHIMVSDKYSEWREARRLALQ